MEKPNDLEVWQRGPIAGVPPLLQPVGHALLQAVEDVEKALTTFPPELVWEKPAGVASVGFHVKHMKGVVDRLFTYAKGETLNEAQMHDLRKESLPDGDQPVQVLIDNFREQVANAITQLRNTDVSTLTEMRGIGRKQIPTTVIGLLFHAAEHVQRHVGQMIVTARILKSQ
jgi:uncharacterized damage-inducible protein DinB